MTWKIFEALWSFTKRIGSQKNKPTHGERHLQHSYSRPLRTGRIDFTFIGEFIRKPTWKECCFLVEDVGHHAIWGRIFNPATNMFMRDFVRYPREDEDWEFYVDAQVVLDNLPVKDVL